MLLEQEEEHRQDKKFFSIYRRHNHRTDDDDENDMTQEPRLLEISRVLPALKLYTNSIARACQFYTINSFHSMKLVPMEAV